MSQISAGYKGSSEILALSTEAKASEGCRWDPRLSLVQLGTFPINVDVVAVAAVVILDSQDEEIWENLQKVFQDKLFGNILKAS